MPLNALGLLELLTAGLLFALVLIGTILMAVGGVVGMLIGAAFAGAIALLYLGVAAGAAALYRRQEVFFQEEAQPEAGAPAGFPLEMGGIDIFRSCDASQLQAIGDLARRRQVPQGGTLATAAEPAGILYCVLDGQAELHARAPMGDITVRVAGRGESFPLASLVGSGQMVTSARAMTDMDVITLPVDALRRLCEEQTEMGARVYAAIAGILAERYRATLRRLTITMQETLRGADFWANI